MHTIVVQVEDRFTMTFDDLATALRYATVWERRYGYGSVRMG